MEQGIMIPGVSRQELTRIKAMSLPDFRLWLLEYSSQIYNLGISDCRDALRAEFGFGDVRLKRMTDHIEKAMKAFFREADNVNEIKERLQAISKHAKALEIKADYLAAKLHPGASEETVHDALLKGIGGVSLTRETLKADEDGLKKELMKL